ncbi:MFS transporter [Agromyces ramosus]|uniref:MFS transporter n=1 Tax=Agromyces ramosus TaxID=33879 RepID=A0A4Q7MJS6_9MICO|nr:MFS transporter [Agromyces ramosus]RZS68494.1 MFS transporter [Agromyces ramosus]
MSPAPTAPASPSPDTDAVPVIEPELAAAASAVDEAEDAEQVGRAPGSGPGTIAADSRPGLLRRLVASVADPVLRILVIATLVSRVGRGIFLTVTVLYFTLIVGLAPHEVAIVLGAASAAGVLSSLAGGWLADRVSARRLLVVLSVIDGVGLVCYVFAHDFVSALVIAMIVGAVEQAANSTRMAIIARAFDGDQRVHARAVLRTVTNVAIAVGSGIGALALLAGTAEAYRWIIVGAGVMYLAGVTQLVKLPHRVDAPTRPASDASVVTTATGSTDVRAPARARRLARRAHSPWRDPRYLALTALSAVFGMQFGVGEVGVPLWIANDTNAPEVLVAVVLILNTVIVVLFQVPLSRGTHDLRRAGRVSAIAAWLMAAACLIYAAASGLPSGFAIAVIVAAAVAHAFAEVLSQAGGWGLSFELADPVRAGTYQGVFSMGYSLGAMVAPLFVTSTALTLGLAGWAVLAAVFLASGLGTWAIAVVSARAAARAAARAVTTAGRQAEGDAERAQPSSA